MNANIRPTLVAGEGWYWRNASIVAPACTRTRLIARNGGALNVFLSSKMR